MAAPLAAAAAAPVPHSKCGNDERECPPFLTVSISLWKEVLEGVTRHWKPICAVVVVVR